MKDPEMKKMDFHKVRLSFQSRAFRAGSYTIIATAVVIAIAVVINLLVGSLPTEYTKLDVTANKLFSISPQTETVVSGLKDQIDIYWLVQRGSENSALRQLLDRYQALSDKIKVTVKDPEVYPNFASQYTTSSPTGNSLIVVCGQRSKYVDFNNIFVTDYTNYYTTGATSTQFAGESELTSAIDYVTSENLPVVYMLKGHGETELSAELRNAMDKQNVEIKDLSLLTMDAMPDDISCLIVYSPKSDLSENEKNIILTYLQAGGKMILITEYSNTDLPNLTAVTKAYGAELVKGIVIEGEASKCVKGYAYYLLPQMNNHNVINPIMEAGYSILMPVAQGIQLSDSLRDTVKVTKLLTTSTKAFSKVAGYNMTTYDKEAGDIDGPFTVGLILTEPVGQEETEIFWLTSAQMLETTSNQMVSGANFDLYLNAVSWMCKQESKITIHAKNLEADYLTVPTSAASAWSFIVIGLIPLAFVGSGVAVVIQRRRK